MAYGIIGFSANGDLNQPSPSIWGDCQSQELLDEGKGLFSYQEYFDVLPNPAGTGAVVAVPGSLSGAFGHALGAVAPVTDGNFDHALKITVGSTALDGVAIYTRPLGPLQSGKKLWMETSVAFGSITATQGGFIGFVCGPDVQNVSGTMTAQAGGLPAPTASTVVTQEAVDPKSGVLAVATTTRTTNTVSTTSFVGFVFTPTGSAGQLKVDIVYLNQPTFSATPTALPATTSTTTTVGTPVYIQLDAMNAATILANLPPGQTSQGVIPGDIKAYTTSTSTPAAYAAAAAYNFGFVKFGIRWDGSGQGQTGFLHFYINGVEVARSQVDNTYDVQSDYGALVNFTGAANGVFYIDFLRAASQIR